MAQGPHHPLIHPLLALKINVVGHPEIAVGAGERAAQKGGLHGANIFSGFNGRGKPQRGFPPVPFPGTCQRR